MDSFWDKNASNIYDLSVTNNHVNSAKTGILVYGAGSPTSPINVTGNIVTHSGGFSRHSGDVSCLTHSFDVESNSTISQSGDTDTFVVGTMTGCDETNNYRPISQSGPACVTRPGRKPSSEGLPWTKSLSFGLPFGAALFERYFRKKRR